MNQKQKEREEREIVYALAEEMVKKLNLRSDRYERLGWRKKSPNVLKTWLQIEVTELLAALATGTPEEIADEVVDVALLSMFIGDVNNKEL